MEWLQDLKTELCGDHRSALAPYRAPFDAEGFRIGHAWIPQLIRTFGQPGKFYNSTNLYLTAGGWKWTMVEEVSDSDLGGPFELVVATDVPGVDVDRLHALCSGLVVVTGGNRWR